LAGWLKQRLVSAARGQGVALRNPRGGLSPRGLDLALPPLLRRQVALPLLLRRGDLLPPRLLRLRLCLR
jgi:hypothetical protein